MARIAQFALFGVADALYARHRSLHCSSGQGGVPLDPSDIPISNVTEAECETACDLASGCTGFTRRASYHHSGSSDCYLLSAVETSECASDNSWETYTQAPEPPLTGNIVYHLFERKYTGLANKDGGDFKGDTGFIFETFQKFSSGNPEASMEHNIIEMSEVNVTGWGTYEQCNAPGANGHFNCPSDQTVYCCTVHDPKNHSHNIPTNHTSDQLPGLEINSHSLGPKYGMPGYWYSFPMESQDVTWTEKLLRRIEGSCLGAAWRKDAGGCDQCNATLDSCVAECIQASLLPDGDTTLLQATWDRVFADKSECPDVPLPAKDILV